MKQKDIALIIIVVAISAALSFFISGLLFGSSSRDQTAEVVQPIVADFEQPDERFFNEKAINPTQTIVIEQNSNPDPFRDSGSQ